MKKDEIFGRIEYGVGVSDVGAGMVFGDER